MWFQNFFKSLPSPSTRRRPTRRSPPASRPRLEALEDRTVPAFLAPVDYPVGGQTVLSADFDNDTILDLMVGGNGNTISVLLGNGDGTFQAAVNSVVNSSAHSLAVGDFNNDTVLDLATTNPYAVNVLLGNGDGSFRPTIHMVGDYESPPLSVAVGDFNGDGDLDLGVLSRILVIEYPNPDDYYDTVSYWEGRAKVLLGNGTGSFASPVASTVSAGYFTDAAVADFNGDGKDDIAATDDRSTLRVSLAKSDGSGNLLASAEYTTGVYLQSVLVGDVNGDGIGDLVTGNGNNVSVLLGNGSAGVGDGTFQAAQTTALGFSTTSLTVGDFNGDGNLDLGAVNNIFVVDYANPNDPYDYYGHYEGHVETLLGDGNGQFAARETTELGIGYLPGIVSGNFDTDDFADLAVTSHNPAVFVASVVSVLLDDQSLPPPPPPPPPPSVSISDVTVTEGDTGMRMANFTVTLSEASSQPVTVSYDTSNNTATSGSDYQASSGTLTIPAGQTTGTIAVLVNGDRLAEQNETFFVNLGSPTNATLADGQAVGTIIDDEPRISINDVTVTEGNTGTVNATFTVSLSVAYDVAVTVHYQTSNGSATAGSDYAAASGDVTIAAGQTTATFTVAVLGDRSAEPTENFVVNLSAATNGLIVDSQGVGTILDDEPRISISDVSKLEGKNGKTLFVFTVTLSAAYDQAVTMSFRTLDGTATTGDNDYIAKTGTLTFAPGETTKTITIEVKGDSKREANETFYLDLYGLSSNGLFTKSRGVGTILNDD